MQSMNDYLMDAYCQEKTNIQEHYQRVVQELDIVKNNLAESIASRDVYEPILRAMTFIRTQTITNIGFEVKEFNQWTCTDIPVSYYPSGSGKAEIAKVQGDIELLDRVAEGKIFGNIFSAKSLVYIADNTPDRGLIEAITSGAAQIFPLTLEQFGAYVGVIADSIVTLDETVKSKSSYTRSNQLSGEINTFSKQLDSEELQQLLETTMRKLNVDILEPMNEWRTAFLDGVEDEFAKVSKREMSKTDTNP